MFKTQEVSILCNTHMHTHTHTHTHMHRYMHTHSREHTHTHRPARYIDVQTNVSNGHGRNLSNDYVRANPSTYRPPYPTSKPPLRPTYSSIGDNIDTDDTDGDLRMSTFNPESSVVPTLARSYSSLSNTLHHVVQNPGAREAEEGVHIHISNGLEGSTTQL